MEKLLARYQPLGYPLIRMGIGFMVCLHGLTKLLKGPAEWEYLGGSFNQLTGLSLPELLLGFSAAFIQTLGGAFIALGLFTRWAALLILPTMLTAVAILLMQHEPFSHYSHPIEITMLLSCFILMGSGKFSLDENIKKHQNKIKSTSDQADSTIKKANVMLMGTPTN